MEFLAANQTGDGDRQTEVEVQFRGLERWAPSLSGWIWDKFRTPAFVVGGIEPTNGIGLDGKPSDQITPGPVGYAGPPLEQLIEVGLLREPARAH
jgi:hypothetical protein